MVRLIKTEFNSFYSNCLDSIVVGSVVNTSVNIEEQKTIHFFDTSTL